MSYHFVEAQSPARKAALKAWEIYGNHDECSDHDKESWICGFVSGWYERDGFSMEYGVPLKRLPHIVMETRRG